jgi:hypothetical protein
MRQAVVKTARLPFTVNIAPKRYNMAIDQRKCPIRGLGGNGMRAERQRASASSAAPANFCFLNRGSSVMTSRGGAVGAVAQPLTQPSDMTDGNEDDEISIV